MPVTKIHTKWESGDLVFYNAAGDELLRLDESAGAVVIDGVTVDSSSLAVTGLDATADELNAVADLSAYEVARTATADGLTTGTIVSRGVDQYVTVTSADANHIIVLPAPVVGRRVTLNVGATGFELRSSTPASIAINGGTGAAAESAIPANSTVLAICISATAWKAIFLDADGDVAKVEAAA